MMVNDGIIVIIPRDITYGFLEIFPTLPDLVRCRMGEDLPADLQRQNSQHHQPDPQPYFPDYLKYAIIRKYWKILFIGLLDLIFVSG